MLQKLRPPNEMQCMEWNDIRYAEESMEYERGIDDEQSNH
jgi:hypothetical protein